MNEQKINKLFEAARSEVAPEVPFNFSRSVMAAIQRGAQPLRASFSDQLAALFPRIGFAAVLIVALSTAADLYFSDTNTPLTVTVEQVAADEWLIAGK
ncbi:MAG: hypothetical protein H0X66_13670 [Verrucomicrobia bacterium]|nr:hypothetical protein [Verrucomicrobiota bacterium]